MDLKECREQIDRIDEELVRLFARRMQVAEEVKRYFKEKVYAVVIPRNVRLSEAPSYGQPVLAYDSSSKGARAYRELAAEVVKRNGG